jgi:hypothetical protein
MWRHNSRTHQKKKRFQPKFDMNPVNRRLKEPCITNQQLVGYLNKNEKISYIFSKSDLSLSLYTKQKKKAERVSGSWFA